MDYISPTYKSIFNLSKTSFPDELYELLNKGLTFIPNNLKITKKIVQKDFLNLTSNLITDLYNFRNNKIQTINNNQKTWISSVLNKTKQSNKHTQHTPINILEKEDINLIAEINLTFDDFLNNSKMIPDSDIIKTNLKQNITKTEITHLNKLKSSLKTELIIKPADKGIGLVIMDQTNYIKEALRQLSDTKYYKPISKPISNDNAIKIKSILLELFEQKYLNKYELNLLLPSQNFSTRLIYFLPKLHKKIDEWFIPNLIPKARPIMSAVNCESYASSIYLESFLHPLTINHPAHIKNTADLINKLSNIILPQNVILFTMDVESLYTNMCLKRTLAIVKNHFKIINQDNNRPNDLLLQLLEIILFKNDFKFLDTLYLQTKGIPMGNSCSTSLANLYLQHLDNTIINSKPITPSFYFRYIDDIIGAWPDTLNTLLEFHAKLNNLIPGIKLTINYNMTSIDFLDITLFKSLSNNNTITLLHKPFFKPTSTFPYVHTTSYHPPHTYKGIMKSQLIRLKRNSSTHIDYINATDTMINSLTKRGYKKQKLYKLRNTLWFNIENNDNKINTYLNNNMIVKPLIIKYNPINIKLLTITANIIKKYNISHHIHFIKVFTNNKNLRKILINKKYP